MTSSRDSAVASSLTLLITGATLAVGVAMTALTPSIVEALRERPLVVVQFALLTLVLQLFSVEVHRGGHIAVSGIGMIACGIALGPGPAMLVAIVAGVVQWLRARGLLHRAIFDAAQLAASSGLAAATYGVVTSFSDATAVQAAGAVGAGIAYTATNNALLCVAIGLSQEAPPLGVWNERFRWAWFHYLAFGPLALAAVLAAEAIGTIGLAAFTLPPALVLLSVRQYLTHTRAAFEKLQAANDELEQTNADLRELLDFTGGLASRAHDRNELVRFAEDTVGRITAATAEIVGPDDGGIPLRNGEQAVGSLRLAHGSQFDARRWERLGTALAAQLATALESADLTHRVRKVHRDTIAALSRSMEAKDFYTGGHTERVADISVALATRLGLEGAELDAVEIGGLLHDIGKIGIPERILHKPEPLNEDEWKVMRDHPVISDFILRDIDVHPIVRQIVRSSHERIDGCGYPDRLAGDEIPLAARVVLVADAFDALTTDRPYRPGRSIPAAIAEIEANAGPQFCARVVAALRELHRDEPQLLGAATPLRVVA